MSAAGGHGGNQGLGGSHMIPAGYMAKNVSKRPDWLKSDDVADIYSLSTCMSNNFADYIKYWKHNGFWLFDSPEIIKELAQEQSIDLSDCTVFYYEVYDKEFHEDSRQWSSFKPEPSFTTNVVAPKEKHCEGYDVVTFSLGTSPEDSPLSCCSLATEIKVNRHCLLDTLDAAKECLEQGLFDQSEPGPFRVLAIYSLLP